MSEVFAASKGISSIRSSSPLHRVTTTTRPAGSLHFQLIFSLSFPSQSLINVLARENPSPSTLLLFTFILNFVLERDPHTTSRPSRPPTPPPEQPAIPAPGEDSHFYLRDTFVRFSLERLSRSPLLRSLFLTLTSFSPLLSLFLQPGFLSRVVLVAAPLDPCPSLPLPPWGVCGNFSPSLLLLLFPLICDHGSAGGFDPSDPAGPPSTPDLHFCFLLWHHHLHLLGDLVSDSVHRTPGVFWANSVPARAHRLFWFFFGGGHSHLSW